MRKPLLFFLLFLVSSFISAQNIYTDYHINDTIKGERLIIGSGNISYSTSTTYGNTVQLSLNGVYSKWKFTPSLLYYTEIFAASSYYRSNGYDPYIVERNQPLITDYRYENNNEAQVGAGISYYFNPRKFYITAAGSASVYNSNWKDSDQDEKESGTAGLGYLWAGLGCGRIDNAEGLESALNFSEALTKYKVTDGRLSDITLREIDRKIYELRNKNYLSKYTDDELIMAMKDIEKILLTNNEIDAPLGAENSVRLYQILLNTSERYYYYPRYIGAQFEAQVQTEVFSYIKPQENYLKILGIYGYPVSEKTNLLITASFAHTLNENTQGYFREFPRYYSYYSYTPDYNNLKFNNYSPGIGVLGEPSSFLYHRSQLNLGFDVTHSLSSIAGLSLRGRYYFYPASDGFDPELFYYYEYTPNIDEHYFDLFTRFDYNIYSKLFAHLSLGFGKSNFASGSNVSLSFNYIVF